MNNIAYVSHLDSDLFFCLLSYEIFDYGRSSTYDWNTTHPQIFIHRVKAQLLVWHLYLCEDTILDIFDILYVLLLST